MEFSHWRANARLVRAFAEKSATLREYLKAHGVEIAGPPPELEKMSRYASMILLKAQGKGHGGSSLVKTMVKQCREMGVDFLFSTPAKKILRNGSRVTGVIGEDKSGREIRINTGAVIISSGGYGDNRDMIKEYAGFYRGQDMFVMKDMKMTG